jgi:hypothetical protein
MIPGVLPAYITVEAYHAKLARLAANAARAETPAWCARGQHCCRVLDLDGTRRGQWDKGKVGGIQGQVGEEVLMEVVEDSEVAWWRRMCR